MLAKTQLVNEVSKVRKRKPGYVPVLVNVFCAPGEMMCSHTSKAVKWARIGDLLDS